MGPTVNGSLGRWSAYGVRISLQVYCIGVRLGPNGAIDIGEWLIGGDGGLERFYCIHSMCHIVNMIKYIVYSAWCKVCSNNNIIMYSITFKY